MLRNVAFALIIAVVILVSGCGGGPGGGSSGGGGSNNVQPGQYFEFFRSGGGWFDPLNLLLGDSGTVVLANYDGVGNRSVLNTNNWSSTSGAVSIVPNADGKTATFTVVGTAGGQFNFRCFTLIAGVNTLFEQRSRTPTATPVVAGRIVELGVFSGLPTNTGMPHVEVDLYNSSGTVVGSARTMPNGTFSALVPTTATHIMAVANTIKTNKYYRAIYYQADMYSPLDPDCRIVLPGLISGVNNMPSSMAVPQVAGGPPPPPSGCS